VARNRKRAKERRVRQAQPVGTGRGGERHPLDNGQQRADRPEPLAEFGTVPLSGRETEDGAPDPIEHAAPDVELAELQLATASPLDAVPEPGPDGDTFEAEPAPGSDGAALEAEPEPARDADGLEAEPEPAEAGPRAAVRGRAAPVPVPDSTVAAPRAWLGARLLAFLEGSWRELQRVQWPDRRQVMQATGVVIGFVIVASIFLGVADLVASKVVSFILKGHF
jgi:preprotein translocase subunit SecE